MVAAQRGNKNPVLEARFDIDNNPLFQCEAVTWPSLRDWQLRGTCASFVGCWLGCCNCSHAPIAEQRLCAASMRSNDG
jgi:hypothetical protein